jgi:L-lactate permease
MELMESVVIIGTFVIGFIIVGCIFLAKHLKENGKYRDIVK